MQAVRAEDQGVGDIGYKEISFGLCVFVAPPVVRDVLRYRAHLERRSGGYAELHRLIQRLCPQLRFDGYAGEDQVLRRFPRRRAGEDDFPPDYCPPSVLYTRTAFCRLGPPDLNLTFASATLWEGPHFADFRGFPQESVFAVLGGPGRLMKSGEPCWLVVCSFRDVHREMVYDRAMHEIFPHHDLRRFVEILPRLCSRNMDIILHVPTIADLIYAFGWFDAQLVFWIPMDHGIRDSLAAALRALLLVALLLETQHRVMPPEAPEPPQRRRRLEPHSALFPATPEPVDEAQSPSAPANENSAGADADS
ncbi:hypothetical protein Emag_000014 [Eimeria magna]